MIDCDLGKSASIAPAARDGFEQLVSEVALRPCDEQVAVIGDPAARRELLEQRLVEPARRAVVDVLDGRLAVTQLRAAQPALEALGVAVGRLAVEQQRQPLGVIQVLGSVLRLQLSEGVGHAVELERSELVDGGMRRLRD